MFANKLRDKKSYIKDNEQTFMKDLKEKNYANVQDSDWSNFLNIRCNVKTILNDQKNKKNLKVIKPEIFMNCIDDYYKSNANRSFNEIVKDLFNSNEKWFIKEVNNKNDSSEQKICFQDNFDQIFQNKNWYENLLSEQKVLMNTAQTLLLRCQSTTDDVLNSKMNEDVENDSKFLENLQNANRSQHEITIAPDSQASENNSTLQIEYPDDLFQSEFKNDNLRANFPSIRQRGIDYESEGVDNVEESYTESSVIEGTNTPLYQSDVKKTSMKKVKKCKNPKEDVTTNRRKPRKQK